MPSKKFPSPELLEEVLDGQVTNNLLLKPRAGTNLQNLILNRIPGTDITHNAIDPFNRAPVAVSTTDAFFRGIIPNFLFKPPFGFPLMKDVVNMRRLSATPFVFMVNKTICDTMSGLDWNIIGRDELNVPENILQQTEDFFKNPNTNEESFPFFQRRLIKDLLDIDAAVIEKGWNLKGDFVGMMVRDGATFTKNPNVHGMLPEIRAYYQFGWITGARPVSFNRNQVVYMIGNPQPNSIYGLSPVEILQDVLQLLVYGVDSNLDYFRDNMVPKGVFQMPGADQKAINAFADSFAQQMKVKGIDGNFRRRFHKMPVTNVDGKFERIAFSNLELQIIQQQEWFSKIVWACYGISPTELGFTQDANKAVAVVESAVGKRKIIKPMTQLLEYHYSTQIINDLPWIKGKWENKVLFDFDKFDLQEELAKRKLYWGDIQNRLRTPNEIRKDEINLEPHKDGDDLGKQGGAFGIESTAGINRSFNEGEENPAGQSTDAETKAVPAVKIEQQNVSAEKGTEANLKKKMTSALAEQTNLIKDLLKKEAGTNKLMEIKAIDNPFIKHLLGIISFDGLKELVTDTIKNSFNIGVEKVETQLDRNFSPNQAALDFIDKHTFANIKGLEAELKEDLRQELQRGILSGEGVSKLAGRVDKVMKVGKVRSEMIARTESNRAENLGSLEAWRQSGEIVEKEWLSTIDGATSAVCKALNGKRIPLNDRFKFRGEEFDGPPALVNCRSSLLFHIVGES